MEKEDLIANALKSHQTHTGNVEAIMQVEHAGTF